MLRQIIIDRILQFQYEYSMNLIFLLYTFIQNMKQVFTTLTILLFLCNCTGSKKNDSIESNIRLESKKILVHFLS